MTNSRSSAFASMLLNDDLLRDLENYCIEYENNLERESQQDDHLIKINITDDALKSKIEWILKCYYSLTRLKDSNFPSSLYLEAYAIYLPPPSYAKTSGKRLESRGVEWVIPEKGLEVSGTGYFLLADPKRSVSAPARSST